MSTAHFLSTRNYLKRSASTQTTNIAGPSVSESGGYIYTTRTSFAHNLGYVPMFRCYYEPFANNVIYPIISLPLQQKANNPTGVGSATGPGLLYWADATNVHVMLYYVSNALAAQSFPVYITSYVDFAIG